MRLATVEAGQGTSAAVLRDGRAVLVNGFADVGALLRAGAEGQHAARRAEAGAGATIEGPRLLRPVLAPGAVVCVGLNYRSHILEMGRELPEHPTLFSKLPRALTDPYAEIVMPRVAEQVDYEGELAAVIGLGGRDILAARGWEHVAGLTLLNDITSRDFQRRTVQWFAGKTFERSTPVGPSVVSLDELDGLEERELSVQVNGEERQRAVLGDLVFDVPALVADLSRIFTLEPGDLIATGTPGGVGEAQGDLLDDGDVVEVSADGLGAIRNTIRRV